MAVSYKGFQVWYCNPTTHENLQYCRNFELSLVTITSSITSRTTVDADGINYIAERMPDIEKGATLGIVALNDELSTTRYNTRIKGIFPLTVTLETPNNTGAPAALKLLAANGSYAISRATITNGYSYFGSAHGSQPFILYNSDGTTSNYELEITAIGPASVSILCGLNFDGGLISPTKNTTTWGALNITPSDNTRFRIEYSAFRMYKEIADWLNAIGPLVPPSDDPYEPGGTSGPGGGDGSFDFSSTPVDFAGAPTIGAYDTGMVNLYVPSAANLRSLSAYLWAGAFDLDNFKKLVADPMDAIIGLSILPLTAAQIGTSASTLSVGNISTGISMPRATSQYVTVDCGSVQILPKWGAYLDFAPYSKLQLYLPYIGIVDISPDDCMNGTIAVRYTVDILSGTCYAQVKCNDHVLYNYGATCSTTCPVTSGQYQNVAFAALGAIGGIAGAVVSGMAGSVGGVTGGIENAANSVLSSFKPDISRSGGAGGSAGLMGHQLPYLILTVPRMCTPGCQNEFIGYPAYSTQTLGDLSGYTEIDSIHPAGIPCSEDELAEIVELLNGGVFL